MGFSSQLFQQTQMFAIERGQLVDDDRTWAIGVEVNDGHVTEQHFLCLEGAELGHVRAADRPRRCCRLADGHSLVARANGRPEPLDASTPIGALVDGGNEPLILTSVGGHKATYTLKGERVQTPRIDQGVAYRSWEILIADAGGNPIEGAPVISVVI